MKMKATLLTIAMLTVIGNMSASDESLVGMLTNQPDMIPQNMIPSARIQQEAAMLYKNMTTLKIGTDGASIQLPEDFATLIQNTLSVIPTSEKEATDLENFFIAYIQIQYPYSGWTTQLTQLMGGNAEFMQAFEKYRAAFQAQLELWNQLWQDTSTRSHQSPISGFMLEMDVKDGNVRAAQNSLNEMMNPIPLSPAQQEAAHQTLTTLLVSSKQLNTQLTNLQTMFIKTNKALGDHLTKINYLVKQNVQWMLAFGMAINPDFAKLLNAETIATLITTLTNLHTSPKVVAIKEQLKAIHAAKMMNH